MIPRHRGGMANTPPFDPKDESAGILAAIVESSDDAIVGKDLNGIVLTWNRGAERLYGYTAQEMKGRSIAVLIPPDRPDELPGILNRIKSRTAGRDLRDGPADEGRPVARRIAGSVSNPGCVGTHPGSLRHRAGHTPAEGGGDGAADERGPLALDRRFSRRRHSHDRREGRHRGIQPGGREDVRVHRRGSAGAERQRADAGALSRRARSVHRPLHPDGRTEDHRHRP